jgi:hypothetical protein
MFQKATVGMEVEDLVLGPGIIENISSGGITIRFERFAEVRRYTLDGKFVNDANQTLFFKGIKVNIKGIKQLREHYINIYKDVCDRIILDDKTYNTREKALENLRDYYDHLDTRCILVLE